VSEEVKGTKRARVDCSPEETELLKQLEKRLQKNLSVEKRTCLNLQSALRKHLLPPAQGKLEMMKRLAFFFDKKEANADAPLLVTAYIREDQDPGVSDREESNDEDPEDAEVLAIIQPAK
jgi:hypothetical protein